MARAGKAAPLADEAVVAAVGVPEELHVVGHVLRGGDGGVRRRPQGRT